MERRLALFGLGSFAAMLLGLVIRLALAYSLGDGLRFSDVAGHALAAVALLSLFVVLRGERGFSTRTLAVLDVAVMNTVAVGLVIMATALPVAAHPTLVLLLALTFLFTMRATYVPSRTRQTLLVHVTAGVWLMVAAAATAARRVSEDGFDPSAAMGAYRGELINAAVWWFFNTGAAAAATNVIYGLRREAREASQLGQYTLTEKIGEGGMGEVYRASHAMLRRATAIKLLPPAKTGERSTARFEREVQRTASLAHPNVVTVFDYGRTPDGIFYYAMELLDGLDLAELVARHGPMPPARVVHVLVQVCAGLAAAHEVGLIHRDIKPANVFLVRGGQTADLAKLTDFGLVKDQHDDGGLAEGIVGTPACMAPEAVRDPGSVDARSDLYGVGAVGYFLLAGRYPFEGEALVDVVAAHLDREPPPIERADLPEALDEVIRRCLAKDRADRPGSAVELGGWLESLEDVPPWLPEQAQAWWEKERAERRPSQPVDVVSPPTFSVDFEGRV